MAMTTQEFSNSIKQKYPEYKDIPDDKLVNAVIKKYPQYAGQIQTAQPERVESNGTKALQQVGNVALDIGKSLIQAPARALSSVVGLAEGVGTLGGAALSAISGDKTGAQQQVQQAGDAIKTGGVFGQTTGFKPVGVTVGDEGTAAQKVGAGLRDIVGTGMELGTSALPAGKLAGVGKKTLGALGALTGAGSAAGTAIREGTPIPEAIGNVAIGSTLGALTGGALGKKSPPLATKATQATKRPLLAPITDTAKDIQKAVKPVTDSARGILGSLAPSMMSDDAVRSSRLSNLQAIGQKKGKVRKTIEKAKGFGVDVEKVVADTDLLVDSVENGRIVAKNAVDTLNDIIDPVDDTIAQLLAQEGKYVDSVVLEDFLASKMKASGIAGADLQKALRKAKNEIKALADENDRIPLTSVHNLKVYLGRKLKQAYYKPEASLSDKETLSALREFIEQNSAENVKAINRDLAELYNIRDYVSALDGEVVKGGRLGGYFARTTGALLGNAAGGIPGGIVVSMVADAIQDRIMANTLGRSTGGVLKVGKALTEGAKKAATKKPLLQLPGPGIGNTPITLPYNPPIKK